MLEKRDLTKNVAYFMIFFVASLRGSMGFIMDAEVFSHHIGKGKGGSPGSCGNSSDDYIKGGGLRADINYRTLSMTQIQG